MVENPHDAGGRRSGQRRDEGAADLDPEVARSLDEQAAIEAELRRNAAPEPDLDDTVVAALRSLLGPDANRRPRGTSDG